MTKKEVKQLVKEAVNKSPPLKNYLEINHIYGKYISKATELMYYYINSWGWNDEHAKLRIEDNIVHNTRPLCNITCLRNYDISIRLMKDILDN